MEPSLGPGKTRERSFKVLTLVLAHLLLIASFLLFYHALGDPIALLAILPIFLAGLFFGFRGGVSSACALLPVMYCLYSAVAPNPLEALVHNWAGILFSFVIGGGIGWMRDIVTLSAKLHEEVEEKRKALDEEIRIRKRTEDQLLWFEKIVNASINGIAVADATRRENSILLVNPAFETMTGYGRTEVIGRGLSLFDGPDTDPAEIGKLQLAMEAGVESRATLKSYRKDGVPFWNEVTITPLLDATGRVTHFIVMQSNVTERMIASEELRKSEEKLRRLVEQSPDGIAMADESGRVIEWNAAMERIIGIRKDDVYGKPVWDVRLGLTPPEFLNEMTRKALEQSSLDLLRKGDDGSDRKMSERWILRPDGSRRLVETLFFAIKTAGGFMGGSVARDITAQRDAENRLRLLTRAVETSPSGIMLADMEGRLQYANPGALSLTGYSVDEAIGKHLSDFAVESSRRQWNAITIPALTASGQWSGEVDLKKKDGSSVPIHTICTMVSDGTGTPQGILSICYDLTERKRTEERLRNSETKFRSYIEHAPMGVLVIDRSRRLVEVNPAGARMFGYTESEFVALSVPEILSPQSHERGIRDFMTVVRRGHVEDELIAKRKDGSQFWVSVSGVKLGDNTFMAFCHDISERKQFEEALGASEAKFRSYIEHAPLGVFVADRNGRIRETNLAAALMLGYTEAQIVRLSIPDLVAPDSAGRAAEGFRLFLERGTAHDEVIFRRSDGSSFWVLVHAVMLDEDRLMAFVKDITERKEAERALRESEGKYRSVVDGVKEVIFRTDVQGIFTFLNPAWEDITGYGVEQSIGQLFLSYVSPDDRGLNVESFRPLIEEKTDFCRHEIRCIRKDGGFRWLEVFARLTKDTDGRITGTAGTLMDVTDRRRAEEATRKANEELEQRVIERTHELRMAVESLNLELEERARVEQLIAEQAALLDKARDAIAVRDLNGYVTYWNKGAERTYGWVSTEVIGKAASSLNLGGENSEREAMAALLSTGEWNGELKRKRKTGEEVTVESRWTLVHNGDEKAKSILMIDTDVTEKRGLESQFLRAQRMESLGTLAGGIAHDLNNILTPLLMWIDVLKDKLQDEKSAKIIDLLESSAHRGAGMVRQVLSFSRGVAGERVEVQPRYLIKEIEKISRESFPKSITFHVNHSRDAWTVIGDPTQLHQVLLNLCVNARDAMPDGGSLSLSCENTVVDDSYSRMHLEARPGRYVVLTVADTGTGIPPKILDRIFEPFFTTKEVGKGTGLGLSTTQAIVKSHKGFINVYSEVGRGTTFKVYLPVTGNGKGTETGAEEGGLERGNGELVLIVDDEAMVRESAQLTLERFGYRTVTASDGAEAIAVYTAHRNEVALVITDMMMPYMDGSATIRALQKINPVVKVIGASGLADNQKSLQAQHLRLSSFIHKPFTARELLKMIRNVLDGTEPQA